MALDFCGQNLSKHERWLYLILLVAFSLTGIFDHTLWASNDAREGSMIWEMVHTGTWVTPIINGQHYLEKPPLLHWTGALFGHLAGGRVNEGIVRLPAALYGFGTLILIWLFGRKVGYERSGMTGAFLCATAIQFLEYSKIVLTDVALTFCVMGSLYLFWAAYSAERGKVWRYGAFILVSAISFYAKGLLGPGFVWVSVGVFLLVRRQWKLAFGLSAIFVPVFVAVLAPWTWALWKTGGRDFVETVFWANQFGRFFTFSAPDLPPDPYHVHKEPICYYLVNLPAMILPWTLLVVAAMAHWFRRGRGLNAPWCLFWRVALLSMLAILHVSSAKVTCYTLPLFPVLFLMTGIWLGDLVGEVSRRRERGVVGVMFALLAVAGFLAPCVYLVMFFAPQALYDRFFDGVRVLELPGPCHGWMGVFLSLVLLGYQTVVWPRLYRLWREGDYDRAVMAFPAAWAVVLMLAFAIVVPAYDYQRSYRPIADMVRPHILAGREVAITINEERYFGGLMFYLDRPVPVLVSGRQIGRFLAVPGRPRGLLVYTWEVDDYLSRLHGRKTQVLQSPHKGYLVEDFRLILVD